MFFQSRKNKFYLLFSVKKFFEWKNSNQWSAVDSLFLDSAHDEQTSHFAWPNHYCLEYYKRLGVNAVRNPEVAGFNPGVGLVFSKSFVDTHFPFLRPKNKIFSTKFEVLDKWVLFFSEIIHFPK